MQPKDEKRQILDVLDYWYFLDFMSQDALPSPLKEPKITGMKNVTVQDIDDPVKSAFGSNPGNRLVDNIVARLDGFEVQKDLPRFTYVHLGGIPREAVVSYLWGKDDKRVDEEIDMIAGAILGVTSTGSFSSFELSPVLWAAYSKNRGVVISEYEECNERIKEELAGQYGNAALTFGDVKEIAEKYVARFLVPVSEAGRLEDPMMEKYLDPLLIDYMASSKDQFSYEVSFRSFFTKDIAALKACVGSVDTLDDLEGGQLALVSRYLAAGLDGQAKDTRESKRVEVLGNNMDLDEGWRFYRWLLSYANIPLGRWPSKYPLSLMQQTAVDLVAGRAHARNGFAANDIMSVNGPPGTGKTTLLKDVIAANIVEKASLLCRYEKPDDAFEDVTLAKRYLRFAPTVHRFKDERINDLGIIVCSSNNAAVENISKELPGAGGLLGGLSDEEAREFVDDELSTMTWPAKKTLKKRDLYFSYAAFNQFKGFDDKVDVEDYDDRNEQNLDLLLAARLGKKANRKDFAYNSLRALPVAKPKNNALSENYAEAKKLFRDQYELVKGKMAKVADADKRQRVSQNEANAAWESRSAAEKELEKAETAYRQALEKASELVASNEALLSTPVDVSSAAALGRCVNELCETVARYEADKRNLVAAVESAEEEEGRLSRAPKTKFKLWFAGKDDELTCAKEKLVAAQNELATFEVSHRRHIELVDLLASLEDAATECSQKARDVEEARRTLGALRQEFDEKHAASKHDAKNAESQKAWAVGKSSPYSGTGNALAFNLCGDGCDLDDLKDVHLFNPVAGKELMHERDLLFLRALQFTREFILSSSCMKDNFAYLEAYWGLESYGAESGKKEIIKFEDEDKKKIAPVAFQALNVLTPVISTTFASAQRLFEDVEIKAGDKAPFGLLVIDEAGQAVPYAALGVLSRCRKTMVVGDPYQIEPVVPQEAKALRSAMAGDIDLFYKGDTASVQKFADELNPYGQSRLVAEDGYVTPTWVGCPLIVHRRCVSPMFDISNEVSYQGSMINETPSLDPAKPADKKKLDSFYLPSSQWLNVTGSERGGRDHYVEEQGKRVLEIVVASFERRPYKDKVPSLYVIAPFKTVVRGIRQALRAKGCRPRGVDENLWEAFVDYNIGTVHTFQGKEALEVVFVLGCDESAEGAVGFVNPNIVNVAASRAKQRLYVVGDYRVWQKNDHVRAMKKILDTTWVKHWEAYRESGDEAELRLARQMMPLGESLPVDDEGICDTESFCDNMSEYTDRLVREADCVKLGFRPIDEIEDMLACCSKDGDNRVLRNLKQGVMLYDVHVCGPHKVDEKFDLTFVLSMFSKATEQYFDLRVLPALKAVMPDYKFSNNQPLLGACERMSLGQYERVIGQRKAPDLLAWRTSLADPQSDGADRRWWKSLSKSIGKFAVKRNEAGHTDDVGLDDLESALDCLGIKQDSACAAGGPRVMILSNDDVYDAALRGAAVQGVEVPDFGNRVPGQETSPILASPSAPALVPTSMPSAASAAAVFSLGDYESQKDDKCLSFGGLSSQDEFAALKQVVCSGKYYSSAVLKLLVKAGYVQVCEFDGISGKFPTQAGAELGIRWRRYDNGAGVVFDPCAQAWLKANLLDLHRRYGGET